MNERIKELAVQPAPTKQPPKVTPEIQIAGKHYWFVKLYLDGIECITIRFDQVPVAPSRGDLITQDFENYKVQRCIYNYQDQVVEVWAYAEGIMN